MMKLGTRSLKRSLLFAMLLVPLLAGGAFGATYFTENFDGSWTSNCPPGWTYTNVNSSWVRATSAYMYYTGGTVYPKSGSYLAFYDGMNILSGYNALMMSPAINISASTQPRVTFWGARDQYSYSGYMEIRISSNGGTNWATLATINSGTSAFVQYGIAIPAAYKTANFKVAVFAYSDWYNGLVIDDVVVDDGAPILTYCSATGSSACCMGIGNVTFNTINNTSGYAMPQYSNYTALSTTVIVGQTYNLSVTASGPNPQYGMAWFDWNQNGSFADAGESYALGYFNISQTLVVPINIPATATAGPTRMRVRTEWYNYGYPPACGTVSYGECEDYTVNVLPGSNTINATPASLTFSAEHTAPLPASQNINVSTSPTSFAWTGSTIQSPVFMSINPTSGTGVGTVVTSITTTTITPGTYNGTVRFTSAISGNKDVPVTYNLIPRVAIAPATDPVLIKIGCTTGGTYNKQVMINNSGGNFGGGVLNWTATSMSPDVTVSTTSGSQGQYLSFSVNTNGMTGGNTYFRSIQLTGVNSVTGIPASNSPYMLTIKIEVEPAGNVQQSKTVNTTWTPFTNSGGQVVAELMSSVTIPSLTLNVTTCTMPQGFSRLRYVRRYFSMSTSASVSNLSARFYYNAGELYPMVTNQAALAVWQQMVLNGAWTYRGGTSYPNSYYVEVSGLTSLAGVFSMAQPWFPKSVALSATAMYDRVSRNAVLQWSSRGLGADEWVIERTTDANLDESSWQYAGATMSSGDDQCAFVDKLSNEGTYYYRLISVDSEGNDIVSQPITLVAASTPEVFALEQNYPNPFNPTTSIRFAVPQTVHVRLKVYDMLWREVTTLVDEVKQAGSYNVSFDATTIPSGAYFYRLDAGTFTDTKRMNVSK